MRVDTLRFGPIELEKDSLIIIKEGLPGFSKLHHFFLVESAEDQLFMWLQSADDSRIAFPVIEPQICSPTYKVPIGERELESLECRDTNRVKVLCIATIPEDPRQMTANLRAPIVISLESQMAMQVISPDSTYPVKHPLFKDLQRFVSSKSDDRNPVHVKTDTKSNEKGYQLHRLKENDF